MKNTAAYATICVSNMTEALTYYKDIIGMEVKSDAPLEGECFDQLYRLKGVKARRIVMGLKDGGDVHLVQHYAHRGWPVSKAMNQYDFCFIHLDIASHQLAEIYRDFQQQGVITNCALQTNERIHNKSISFKGPDYVQLETHDWWVKHPWIKIEPKEKGFYAFVHTALSVSDLNRTLFLYRDLLDFPLVRQSHLEGEEFEKMDCLERGAIAQNVKVRADEGPEIQFLWHYAGTHHSRGKPIGRTMQQCDHAIVNIGIKTDDIEGLHKLLKKEGVVVNCDVQVNPDRTRSFSFRDPDGNFIIAEG